MNKAFQQYVDAMGLDASFHTTVDRCVGLLKQMNGVDAKSILLTPSKDFLGNTCFELWLFNDHFLLNGGILVKAARDRSLEVVALHQVLSFKLTSKHYDLSAYPEVEPDEMSEMTFHCRIRDYDKGLIIEVAGANCKHLQAIIMRHFARNLK